MTSIVGSLLGALILSWFGFDELVIKGFDEVLNKNITSTGYYFIFAIIGALRAIFAKPTASLKFNTDKSKK